MQLKTYHYMQSHICFKIFQIRFYSYFKWNTPSLSMSLSITLVWWCVHVYGHIESWVRHVWLWVSLRPLCIILLMSTNVYTHVKLMDLVLVPYRTYELILQVGPWWHDHAPHITIYQSRHRGILDHPIILQYNLDWPSNITLFFISELY